MKVLNKAKYLLIVLILLVVNFSIPTKEVVEARTLRDIKTELAERKKEYEENKDKEKLTKEEMEKKSEEINSISRQINNARDEIQALTVEIGEKEEEIKRIINYYQLSSSEPAYLEYIFNAVDFTDFIYRMAVSEQLSSYNDNLIDEYHNKIKENEQKKKDLDNKTIELNEKQKQLEKELDSLGSQMSEITDMTISVEAEIRALEELVDTYENKLKCDLDEDITTCGTGQLPPGTAFFRPVVSGYISSTFGPRTYYLNGKLVSDTHFGVDIGGNSYGTPVYSTANGKVALIVRVTEAEKKKAKSVCGGNQIYIYHTVNGKNYTSGYMHLSSINVSVGDIVTPDTIIGAVGGNESYERCSTAVHLHFQLANGHIPPASEDDTGYYSRIVSKSFDPTTVVNFPGYLVRFKNRTNAY